MKIAAYNYRDFDEAQFFEKFAKEYQVEIIPIREAPTVENAALAESIQAEIYKKYPQADVQFRHCRGLCSYYAEKGGILT